jgi:hypothetical protein
MLFSLLGLEKGTVLKLISWKHSFKRLNEEYEIAKKKKQALDNLFESGRISQATRDSFDNDINTVIMEIEKQQNELLVKMQGKSQELESQVKILETLLANYEIQHVVGEIDEEAYQREINLLSTGLESAKRELDVIKDATNQLCPPIEETTAETSLPAEENEAEVIQDEPAENIPSAPDEVEVTTEPYPQEPVVTMEEAVPEQPEIENPISAEMPQEAEEAPQETEDQTQFTEETLPIVEETTETTEDNPEVTEEAEDMSQAMDETTEITEDNPENTEEMPQNAEETPQEIEEQPQITEETSPLLEETPNAIEDEPQEVEDTPQLVEEMPEEVQPSEESEEAPQEITVETIVEEGQEAEETVASADTDEDAENQDI